MPTLHKISSRWLLVAPLAFSAFTISPAHAKDPEPRTPTDFLLNRKFDNHTTLFDIAKVRGGWETERYTVINGFPYRRSIVARGANETFTVSLGQKFDRFQAWVGTREGGGRNNHNVFRVLGDGQELFKSSELSSFDGAERINISVSGVNSLQLIVESTGEAQARGVFAEPVFTIANKSEKDSVTAGKGDLVDVVRPENGPVEVQVGGNKVDFGTDAPVVRGNRVLVPMTQLFDQIGATVDYDAVTHNITVTRNGHRLDLTVGSTAARIDGQVVYLDVPVQTLRAATVYETLKPTESTPTTSAMTPVAPTGGAATSALPNLNNSTSNPAAITTPPATVVKPKDTDTTVTKASEAKPADSGPILVPLRFIAEAFNLPVGVEYF